MGGSSVGRSRLYVELVAIVLGWLTWVGSRGLAAYMWGKPAPDLLTTLVRVALTGVLMTVLLYGALHFITRRRLVTAGTVAGALVATLLFSYLTEVTNTAFARLQIGETPLVFSPFYRVYISGTLNWYIVFAGQTLLFFLIGIWWELEGERRRSLQAAVLAREARLQMLRYQLNPDFLFSVLHAIGDVMRQDRARADRLVTDLSAFLRSTLIEEDRLEITLDRELETIGNYLSIQQMRFGDALRVTMRAEDEARAWTVPAFLVQSLVENAVKHGLKSGSPLLHVTIAAAVRDGALHIDVANTGHLAANGAGQNGGGAGMGLRNVRLHLEHCCPGRHAFQLEERAGEVHATLRIEPEHVHA